MTATVEIVIEEIVPEVVVEGDTINVIVSTAQQGPGGPGSGVTDHGDLTGLDDDDHEQYALADGSRGDFEAAGAVAAHAAVTTGAHGLPDPASLVVISDSRLTDARVPTAHKTSHATGGSDVLTPGDIGAATSGHNHSGTYDPAGTSAAGIAAHEGASDPHTGYVLESTVGQADGVASLDSGGKLPTGQLPVLAITEVFPNVTSEAAMLALTAQRGDVALRTDVDTNYILSTDDPTDVDNWIAFLAPVGTVLSVNGQTGVVTLTYSDVGAAAAGHNHDSAYDALGAAAAAQAASQPLDGDLTALAALGSTGVPRRTGANTWDQVTLGTAAVVDTGTGASNAILGNDARLTDARTPSAHNHAASEVTSGTLGIARVASGTPTGAKFVRDDSTLVVPTVDVVSNVATATVLGRNTAGSGDSEELSVATARTLLGIPGLVGGQDEGSAVTLTSAGAASILDAAITLPTSPAAGTVFSFFAVVSLLNNTGANQTYTFQLLLGSTVIATLTPAVLSASSNARPVVWSGAIRIEGASDQNGYEMVLINNAGTSAVGVFQQFYGVAAEDMSNAKTLDLKILGSTTATTQTATVQVFAVTKAAA